MEQTTLIKLAELADSPFQYRKTYNQATLEAMAETMRDKTPEVALQQPIVVRPVTQGDVEYRFEVVFGHRRRRAMALAGHGEIPAFVRVMTDAEVKQAQLIENLQREDVSALEEADGFQAMIDEHGLSADQIAVLVGQSRTYVYNRLKLATLSPPLRAAFNAGHFGAEIATKLARIPSEKLQVKALEAIRSNIPSELGDGGKSSVRRISDMLAERFSLKLKEAIFDTEDVTLLDGAGACGSCPKRTGCSPEVYGDIIAKAKEKYAYGNVGADICTDPDCYADKKAAHLKRKAEELLAKGKEVIDGNKARQAISAHGEVKGAYIAVSDVRDQLKKVAKTEKPKTVVIQDPRTGKLVEAIRRDELQAAGVKAPPSRDEQRQKDIEKRDRERQKWEDKAAAEMKLRAEIFTRTIAAMRAQPRTLDELVLVARQALAGTDHYGKQFLAAHHDMRSVEELEKALQLWPADALAVFMIECVLADQVHVNAWNMQHNRQREAATLLMSTATSYGIDPAAVRAELEGASTPPPAARAQKEGAAKAKKAPAKKGAAGAEPAAQAPAKGAAKGKGKPAPKPAARAPENGVLPLEESQSVDAGGSEAAAEAMEGAGA